MNMKALISAVGMLLLFVGVLNVPADGRQMVSVDGLTFLVNMVIGLVMTFWTILGDEK